MSGNPFSISSLFQSLTFQVLANPATYNITWRHNGKRLPEDVGAGIIIGNQTLVLQKVTSPSSPALASLWSSSSSSPLPMQWSSWAGDSCCCRSVHLRRLQLGRGRGEQCRPPWYQVPSLVCAGICVGVANVDSNILDINFRCQPLVVLLQLNCSIVYL